MNLIFENPSLPHTWQMHSQQVDFMASWLIPRDKAILNSVEGAVMLPDANRVRVGGVQGDLNRFKTAPAIQKVF